MAWSCIFSFGYDRIFRNLRAAAVLYRAVRGGSYGNYFTDHGTDLCKSDGTFPAISVSGIFAGRSADVRNHSDVDFRLYLDNGGFTDPVSAVSETDGGSQRRFG